MQLLQFEEASEVKIEEDGKMEVDSEMDSREKFDQRQKEFVKQMRKSSASWPQGMNNSASRRRKLWAKDSGGIASASRRRKVGQQCISVKWVLL